MEARQLLGDLKRTIDELQAFDEIGRALTSTLELREVLRLILEKVRALLQPTNFSLLLHDEPKGELVFEFAVGPASEKLVGRCFPITEGIAGWVARTGEPLLVPDVRADKRFAARFDAETSFQTVSVLAAPLMTKGRALGVIELVNGPDGPAFRPEDLRTLRSIAGYAAIALDNARAFERIHELTITDEHTGLYNARHLRRQLEHEVARVRRFSHPLSLVFFDLDHFKQVNDTFGHQVGSSLLTAIGALLRQQIRNTDVPVRWGGDEFVVLLPETPKEAAVQVAQRIRDAMVERPFHPQPSLAVRITASFGVATFPDDAQDEESLLRAADLAMYRAKAKGRDRVEPA